jgi:F-type H+-transporting ATPase subunit a
MPKGLYLYLATFLLISFSTLSAKESNSKEGEQTGDLKSEIKAYILHHLEDSHDFNLLSYKDKTTNKKVYIGMPLPVILWDDGLKVFSSSQLKHGKKVCTVGGGSL